MAGKRIHGRRGRVYLGIASDTSTAEPLPFVAKWSIDFETDREDVTAFEDIHKVTVQGLAGVAGEFEGFFDDGSAQTYQAALDGKPRKFYLYPSLDSPGIYWFGTINVDCSFEGEVSSSVKMKAGWDAASLVAKVG